MKPNKFKTNPLAIKIKAENEARVLESALSEVYDNADQVKSCTKYGTTAISYFNALAIGLVLGLVLGVGLSMIIITPWIIQACN